MVEMLYDPMFVPNDPHQEHDPERVRSMLNIWWKLTRTAPEKYTSTQEAVFERYEEQQRKPLVSELIIMLQNFEQLPPPHTYVSAISEVTERPNEMEEQDGILEELSL